MSPSDIPRVVELQTAFLKGSVVTELGPGFLTRFHTIALQHAASYAFVARDTAGRILGFALGSVDVHGFNQFMKPRIFAALVRSLMAPSRIGLIASLAKMMMEGEPQPPMPAELLLLVVDPNARRRGIGAGLLEALEGAFATHKVERYRVAVRSHLEAAQAFYSALRFEHEQDRTVLGRPMVYLTKRVLVSSSVR